ESVFWDSQRETAMPVTRAIGMAMPASSSMNTNHATDDGTISNAKPMVASRRTVGNDSISWLVRIPLCLACTSAQCVRGILIGLCADQHFRRVDPIQLAGITGAN